MRFGITTNLDLALRPELPDNFEKKTNTLFAYFLEGLKANDLSRYLALMDSETQENIMYFMNESVEISKLFAAGIITMAVRKMDEKGVPKSVGAVFQRNVFIELVKCKSITEIFALYNEFFQEIFKLTKLYYEKKYSNVVLRAITYIYNHRFIHIIPRDVSNGINYNNSYLSKKFKQETNMNLSDYIHMGKMDIAKELLDRNVCNLLTISETLGYSSYSYFSKIFKKTFGLSPSQYLSS